MHLVVHKLFKKIGLQPVLQGIHLDVRSKGLTVLLGDRGSGKTLLLRILAGIEHPDVGSIFLQGEEIVNLKASRRAVGIVFDYPYFFEHLTIYDNLSLVIKKQKDSSLSDEDRIRLITEEFQFSHLLLSLPKELTPLQLFTAQLVRALINEPSILLIDEPFEQISSVHYNELRLLLKSLITKKGYTLLVATRFSEQAQLLANRLAIIDQGMIKQVDTPEKLYKKPQSIHIANSIYTQGFNAIRGYIYRRLKYSIYVRLCDKVEVQVLVSGDKIIEYDQDVVIVAIPAQFFSFEQNEQESLQSVQARLLEVEVSNNTVRSHWQLDEDTLIEVHTDTKPRTNIGAISSIFFDKKDAFVYSDTGILLSATS